MDLATLKAFKPSEYQEAADGYRAVSEMACSAKDTIDNKVAAGIRNSLEGRAAKAALGELAELSKDFHYAQTECGLVGTALNGFAYDMAAAKRKLEAALADAEAAGCTVGADGSVSFPAGGTEVDGKVPEGGTVSVSTSATDPTSAALERQAVHMHPNPNFGKAVELANRIGDALKEATDADAKWAPKLRALKADDDLAVADRDWADAKSDQDGVSEAGKKYLDSLPQPPKDGSPKDHAAWWKDLSDEERAAWVSLRPDAVGKLDGLPSAVRDEANRVVFDETRARQQMELNSIPKPPANKWTWITAGGYPSKVHTDEWMEWNRKYGDRYDFLTKSLHGMQDIQKRFDATGTNELPEAYLLGFSTEGDGRAIIANGNPDTADHQAVCVPGTTSDLNSISGNIDRMVNLWGAARSDADGKTVATITWLGYDAPDDVVKDAPFEHYAYDGAPALTKFLDGLETSHTGDTPPHRTVIGHSYGTTLIGAAAEKGTLNADDIVLAGSPGVKVSQATEMDVPKGHVWNEEAEGDVVPDLGRWGHGGDWFVIPSDPEFGANQMTTDTEGHSGYWNPGSDSLTNQAYVVTGHGDDVPLKPPPDYWAHVK
ncbi:alpha/beta hydrolase [Streptomyces sp. NRRL WC-3744]|uniref:alpha/beta hydrolase n=1 Tax=Streptomyces sp. NRRL WC-3744 TaxID=1463935 RepID=UPI0005660B00|nr:alpha/beta hydrolase [Streptomyces sp. NRRL WC-3744]